MLYHLAHLLLLVKYLPSLLVLLLPSPISIGDTFCHFIITHRTYDKTMVSNCDFCIRVSVGDKAEPE